MSKEYDMEAGAKPHFANETDSNEYIADEGAVHAETFVVGDSWYAKTQRLAGKFGVEQRGIERVPSDERLDAGMSQIGTLVRFLNHSPSSLQELTEKYSGSLPTWSSLLSPLEH
jgi:hypothetical protein